MASPSGELSRTSERREVSSAFSSGRERNGVGRRRAAFAPPRSGNLPHEKARTRLHISRNASDVFAEQSHPEQLDTEEEKEDGEDREHALRRPVRAVDEPQYEEETAEKEADDRQHAARHAEQAQRRSRRAHEQVEIQ